jgi:hypothetical protein
MAFNKSVSQELTERIMNLSKYDSFIPSEYQQSLIDFIMQGEGNGVVQAVAGSGKTTTIMQALNELRKAYGKKSTAKIVEQLGFKDVVSYGGILYKAGTTHSVCGKAGRDLAGYITYSGKVKRIINGGKQMTIKNKYSRGVFTLPPLKGFGEDIENLIYDGVKSQYKLSEPKLGKMVRTLRYQFADTLARLVDVMKNCGVGIFSYRPMTAQTARDLYDYYGLRPFYKEKKLAVYELYFEPEMFEMAIKVLKFSNNFLAKTIVHPTTGQSIKVASVWDLTDMFYLTALYDAPMPAYDYVFLDECQDTNLVTQMLVRRMVEGKGKNGRAIAVGDVAQAIYAFRGADANAMQQFTNDFKATTIPLSLCYRCGSKIITEVNQIFNHNSQEYPYTQIQSLPSAPEGLVFNSTAVSTLEPQQLKALFNNKTGVICRKNAPLLSLCTKLFVAGIAVNFLGREDTGKQIIGKFSYFVFTIFKKKWDKYKKKYTAGSFDSNNKYHNYKHVDELNGNLTAWTTELEKYLQNEVEAYEENGEIDKIDNITDEVEAVIHLIEMVGQKYGNNGINLDNVTKLVQDLFSEDALQNAVTLTSVHRSKGLEFHRAIILDYQGSFFPDWVFQPHLYEQECNMAYVALTRAERELIFINLGE